MNISRNVPHRVLGTAILVLLALTAATPVVLAAPVSTPRISGVSSQASSPQNIRFTSMTKSSGQPALTPAKQSDCQKFKPPSSSPYVEFCKPIYDGQVNGPFGSHVVLAIGGFSPSDKILSVAVSADSCTGKPSTCQQLGGIASVSPQNDPVFVQFDWTFDPTTVPANSYYAVVTYTPNGKTPTQQKASSKPFVLLPVQAGSAQSVQAPCITVSQDQLRPKADPATTCPASSKLFVLPGDKLWITGTGWMALDGNGSPIQQTITVLACPQSKTNCADSTADVAFAETPIQVPQATQDGADQTNTTDGVFQTQVTVKSGAQGTYQIVATNSLPSIDANNNADGSMTFGTLSGQPTSSVVVSPFPCLTTVSGGDCSSQGSATFFSGNVVRIYGQHWIPNDTVEVKIQPTVCSSSGSASAPSGAQRGGSSTVPLGASAPATDDAIQGPRPTPTHGSSGAGIVPVSGTANVDGSGNLQISLVAPRVTGKQAKMYMCAIDTAHKEWVYPLASSKSGLFLTVKPAPVPSPLQKLLIVLGALFALVSLCAFVVTLPKRTVAPQPVARR